MILNVLRKIESYLRFLERTFGSLKFAIVIILLFTVGLIVGTLVESYHGTDYANRLVYKSPLFMAIQFFIFLSIFCATTLRLPPKKRLYGFYILHLGLLLIFIGSFVTYHAGVDGSITLFPQTPTRSIQLTNDIVTISYPEKEKQITYQLPYVVGEQELKTNWENIELHKYYPYSENKLEWKSFINMGEGEIRKSYHSSEYMIFNENVSQTFVTSLHPEAQNFPASLSLGPLSIHYLPQELLPCFAQNHASKLIIWNSDNKSCFTPEEEGIPLQVTKNGHRFIAFRGKESDQIYTFFPDFSPWPMNEEFKANQQSPLKIFSQKLFEDKPHLFLFGLGASFFTEGQWVAKKINLTEQNIIELPWMNFKLRLLTHHEEKRPEWVPYYTKPIQENGQMIKGERKSLLVKVLGQSYWVQSDRPLSLLVQGERVNIEIKKEELKLPFELSLDQFKMDTDPGTKNPASYESFLTLFHPEGYHKHHVFMNNPLKYQQFTFYQASYFPLQEGGFGSVLSANFDPGRFLKYLGSLLLVIGSMIHYVLNKDRWQKEKLLKKSLGPSLSPSNSKNAELKNGDAQINHDLNSEPMLPV